MMLRSPKYLLAIAALSCMAIPSFASSPMFAESATCKAPEFPERALKHSEEGVSVLGFLLRADGTVADASVISSSGSRDLDRAAKLALSRCVFDRTAAGEHRTEYWRRVEYAWLYTDDESMGRARQSAALAARSGSLAARYHLSLVLAHTAKNDAERGQALAILRSAAELGHAHAQFDLGRHYEKGNEVKADFEEALRWYRKSAAQGDVFATQRLTLGVLLEE